VSSISPEAGPTTDWPPRLQRFHDAQAGAHDGAVAELRNGRKAGHWMWFVFPQLAGLGRSETSRFYAIESLAEARAYLADPVLGRRLHEAVRALLDSRGRSAAAVLGEIDARKLRSSMTLFARADPGDPVFATVLDRFFEGRPDELTDELLGGG